MCAFYLSLQNNLYSHIYCNICIYYKFFMKYHRLLKDSLENSNLTIILNLTPSLMQLEESINCLKYAQKACEIQTLKKTNLNPNSNETKKLTQYDDEISKYKSNLEELRHSLASKIHNQHLIKDSSLTNSANFHSKFERTLKEIHSHFEEEISYKKDLINEKRKFEILKSELSQYEYALYKIQHENDNIVHKEKGISLKIKDYQKEISRCNDEIIKIKLRIQDKYQKFTDKSKAREDLEQNVSKLLNEPLGSSLNVAYQSYVLKVDKLDKEFENQVKLYEIKKNEWEINKLMSQIMARDKAIEAASLDLQNKGVNLNNIEKEKSGLLKIQDYRIDHTVIINNSEPINASNIKSSLSLTNNQGEKNNKKNNSNTDNIGSIGNKATNGVTSPKSGGDFERIPHIKFNVNPNNPYGKNIPLKKNYNKNNPLTVKFVKEVTPGMYDYSDYKNPNIFKEKTKFNTKTSKIIEAGERGKLTELKMRVLDSMYPNSRVAFQYDNNKSRDRSLIKDNDKINLSVISNNSNKQLNSSQEERDISRKISKNLPKSILNRYKGSPYIKLPAI
jgi:hypothetical protein